MFCLFCLKVSRQHTAFIVYASLVFFYRNTETSTTTDTSRATSTSARLRSLFNTPEIPPVVAYATLVRFPAILKHPATTTSLPRRHYTSNTPPTRLLLRWFLMGKLR